MKIELMSDEDYRRCANEPQSPPVFTDTFTEETFSNEFYGFIESVMAAASSFGAEHREGFGGDYLVSNGFEYARRVSLELHTPKLLTSAFLEKLTEVIRRDGPSYRIDVTHDMLDVDFVFLLLYKDRAFAVSETMTPLLLKLSGGASLPE